MKVNFIALNFMDFHTENNEHIEGVNAWYTIPSNSPNWIGSRPVKKFFSAEYIPTFRSNGVGSYEVDTDLSGRVSSVRFVSK